MAFFSSFSLVRSPESVSLIPTQDPSICLQIDSKNGTVQQTVPPNGNKEKIGAFFGIIQLLIGRYLVTAPESEKVGEIRGKEIHRVRRFRLIALEPTLVASVSAALSADESEYKAMVEAALAIPSYYFATSLDLTRPVMRQLNAAGDTCLLPEAGASADSFRAQSALALADERHWWNKHLQQDLLAVPSLARFTLPLIMGQISIRSGCRIGSLSFDFALISRRSRHRAGTRYNVRGLDDTGNCANSVETEQLVLLPSGEIHATVTVRGSIPLYWSQFANIKYKPRPALAPGGVAAHSVPAERHFRELRSAYGDVTCVNLVDQKGAEAAIEKLMGNVVNVVGNKLGGPERLNYVAFDFHEECKKMRYDNLSKLEAATEADATRFGFTHVLPNNKVVTRQSGVIRVNCMDNLDRTNVVQGLFMRRALVGQLAALGVPSLDAPDAAAFESIRRNVWADNGDAISVQYSGTGALKNDFTRTGKRTKRGLIMDGVNSVTRYWLNNFRDGWRQDALDLLLGNATVANSAESPLTRSRRTLGMYALFLVLASAMLVVSASLHSANPVIPYPALCLFLLIVATIMSITRFGRRLVDRPRL
eukprot:CAMPEP_0170743066 /NCGR_PEP_ID=MMETSP0437-20130122/7073_1 /TAXON_ID=0 /ORGANISM="Sexangularia sp." /LENGTH=591 /DNA_ID=CAMNT_0011081717 /DNA_START=28 /DNA_END=1800 /DNA_ORIENTATION=+